MKKRPTIVCLCGSTRFRREFESASETFTLNGHIVLSVGVFTHSVSLPDHKKQELDELHLRKIEMADLVFVINPGGYVGESTAREINYATQLRKPIAWYERPKGGCR